MDTALPLEKLWSEPPPAVGKSVVRIDDGLYLQTKGRSSAWVHRYMLDGKARWSGLGSVRTTTLDQAKTKLAAQRRLIDAARQGVQAARLKRRLRDVVVAA